MINPFTQIHQEKQYLQLIKNIMYFGEKRQTRNSVTKSIFGATMRFSLQNNTIPFITTKKLAWKSCFHELFWFIRGNTDESWLRNRRVPIWKNNASRDFLDKHGFTYRKEGDLGPIYGHQWRHFNARYDTCDTDYSNQGIDQLKQVIRVLSGKDDKENKYSRRMIVSAWNPEQLQDMALPPCHVLYQFYVNNNDELSCALYQRSGDVGLGVPFNIASYSLLTHLIAKHVGLKAGEFVYNLGDCHIYENHEDALKEQLEREPKPFPKVSILNTYKSIDEYDICDIRIHDYKYWPSINMKMIA